MLQNNERTCTIRMGEYVQIEPATILEKFEGACTSRNERVCTDRIRQTIVNCPANTYIVQGRIQDFKLAGRT